MKWRVKYIVMADIFQSKKYDTRPFPKEERRAVVLPAVVEAGVKQELGFLNSVYENVAGGVLTEEQGAEIMWMITNPSTLFPESVDLLYTEEFTNLREILEDCIIEDLPISGGGVVPKSIIYESGKPDSIYKEFPWIRVFGEETDPLAISMNRRMNYLENELHSYFESYGERGFENDGSCVYLESSDPESELSLKDYLEMVTTTATITNTISAEDGVTILSFLEACLMDEFSVGAMAPVVVPGEEDILTKNPEKKPIKHAVIPENARMTEAVINSMLHEHGWYTFEAAVVYKNNIVFDSIARKLYNNLGSLIKQSNPENPDASFKATLNMKKNQYRFSFVDNDDPKINDTVRAKILTTGFSPIKENGKVVQYKMEKKPITITVSFEGIDTGLDVEYTGTATESVVVDTGASRQPVVSLEADNFMKDKLLLMCESSSFGNSFSEISETVANAPMYTQVQYIKNNWGEVATISEACDVLLSAMECDTDDMDTSMIDQALTVIGNVVYTETACEAVLDAAEFAEEMSESASKEDIDPEIKPIIELLNRLGYKTKYSSAGYRKERSKDDRDKNGVYYGKLYTTARITFDGNYKFDKLPKGWYQNFNSDVTGIYVKPFTYDEKDGSPDEAFSKWKSEYIAALKDWAENLKEAKDTKVEETADAIKESAAGFFDQPT